MRLCSFNTHDLSTSEGLAEAAFNDLLGGEVVVPLTALIEETEDLYQPPAIRRLWRGEVPGMDEIMRVLRSPP